MDLGGTRLVATNFYSLPKLLSNVYPEYDWLPWKFHACPRFYWKDIDNQRKFITWAEKELNIKNKDDWYSVSTSVSLSSIYLIKNSKEISKLGGVSLLTVYSFSPLKLLSAIYPEHEWSPWRFSRLAGEKDNSAKQFMEMVAKEMKLTEPSDWYNVSKKDLLRFAKGDKILRAHGFSLFNLLNAIYPEQGWVPWKFSSRPGWYWANPNDWKPLMDYVAKKLNVNEPSDWYKIKSEVKKITFIRNMFIFFCSKLLN